MQGMVSLSNLRQGLSMSRGQIDRLISDGFFAAAISMEPQEAPIRGFDDALRLVALKAFPGYPDALAGVVASFYRSASADRWLIVSRRPEPDGKVVDISEACQGRSVHRQFVVQIIDDANLAVALGACEARGERDIRVREFDRLRSEAENAFRRALTARGQTNFEVAP